MLWFSGTSTIRVVEIPKMRVIKDIPDMIPFFNEREFGIALRGVHKNRGNQILIAFVISNVFSFSFYEEGKEIEPRLGTHVLPKCKYNFFLNFIFYIQLREKKRERKKKYLNIYRKKFCYDFKEKLCYGFKEKF